MISSYINENQKDWDQNLDLIGFAYNTAVQSTTKFSPFYLMYGREPKIQLDLFNTEIIIDPALDSEEYASQLKHKLEQAYKIETKNRGHQINLATIRHNRTVRAAKFSWRWKGPYVVLKVFGNTTYEIKPINKRGRNIVVHRDRLKRNFLRPNIFIETAPTVIKVEND